MNANDYKKLLTPNFRFWFSNAADPVLAQAYPDGWTKTDEMIATQNLFEGGTDSDGIYREAAAKIEVDFTSTAPVDDNSSGRDPGRYKTLLTAAYLRVELPGDIAYEAGQAPPQIHRFFFVRGDAADSLDADQPADSLHWYIYEWRDESLALTQPSLGPTETKSSTWGRIKGLYR